MADNNIQPGAEPPDDNVRSADQRKAAADVIRGSIDHLYENEGAPLAEIEQEVAARQAEQTAPSHAAVSPLPATTQLQNYHTSWQSYYQQYYERYYLHHLQRVKSRFNEPNESVIPKAIISSHPAEDRKEDTEINQLRDQLLDTVKGRAETVRRSRHFAPIATAVIFALVFLFLQYNRLMFATVEAYVSPGSIDPQNVIVDPSTSTVVGPEPKLIIPKINIEAPVIYGVNSGDNGAVENNLRSGVVHYPIQGAASVPGQNGPAVILGHSSNDVFDTGAYKFVFVQLSKLEIGDTFYINYEKTRYTYSVTKKEIIEPTEISKVTADPSKPSAILITCEPPGTALKRLLVFADQISPDPLKASESTAKPTVSSTNIAGNSPTLIERLFGIR